MKLFSPEHSKGMYPHPLGTLGTTIQSQIDLSLSEEQISNQFPEFSRKWEQNCELRDGDLLFIPYGWWHQVTSPEVVISVNFFCGDARHEDFLAKLFSPRLFPTFSFWLLNLVEQNRAHGDKHWCQIERYSDEQLAHSLQQMIITRYHCPLADENLERTVQYVRQYCVRRDEEEGLPSTGLKSEKPPKLKIRGLRWRIDGMTMKAPGPRKGGKKANAPPRDTLPE